MAKPELAWDVPIASWTPDLPQLCAECGDASVRDTRLTTAHVHTPECQGSALALVPLCHRCSANVTLGRLAPVARTGFALTAGAVTTWFVSMHPWWPLAVHALAGGLAALLVELVLGGLAARSRPFGPSLPVTLHSLSPRGLVLRARSEAFAAALAAQHGVVPAPVPAAHAFRSLAVLSVAGSFLVGALFTSFGYSTAVLSNPTQAPMVWSLPGAFSVTVPPGPLNGRTLRIPAGTPLRLHAASGGVLHDVPVFAPPGTRVLVDADGLTCFRVQVLRYSAGGESREPEESYPLTPAHTHALTADFIALQAPPAHLTLREGEYRAERSWVQYARCPEPTADEVQP